MKIIFVRHGQDDDGYRGGWSGLDLVAEGMRQARQLARHLKEHAGEYGITQIISSDLQRAMTTANCIAAELGLNVHKEFRLREINNGDLAGMPNEAAMERYPGLFFSSLDMDEAYPNGESPNDFHVRIQGWFADFCAACRNADGNALVVTHGGVINIIYHLVNHMEWSNKRRAFKAANCSMHILDVDAMKFEVENSTDFLSS